MITCFPITPIVAEISERTTCAKPPKLKIVLAFDSPTQSTYSPRQIMVSRAMNLKQSASKNSAADDSREHLKSSLADPINRNKIKEHILSIYLDGVLEK